jgi:hypothetical protein
MDERTNDEIQVELESGNMFFGFPRASGQVQTFVNIEQVMFIEFTHGVEVRITMVNGAVFTIPAKSPAYQRLWDEISG